MGRVTDKQVRILREEMAKHGVVEVAAMKANMHRNTARKYLNTDRFPSDLRQPRDWRTRTDPFAEDWATIAERLADAPELEAKHLFWDLMRLRPGVYQEGQLRTFQRRVRVWQAQHGPDKEVFFPQEHIPGEAMQTDFTWATELQVTIQGEAFPHMLCHMVLPWSNWNYVTVSQSESMLALRNGIASALVQLGRVPRFHQTDNSTAATHRITGKDEAEEGVWFRQSCLISAHVLDSLKGLEESAPWESTTMHPYRSNLARSSPGSSPGEPPRIQVRRCPPNCGRRLPPGLPAMGSTGFARPWA